MGFGKLEGLGEVFGREELGVGGGEDRRRLVVGLVGALSRGTRFAGEDGERRGVAGFGESGGGRGRGRIRGGESGGGFDQIQIQSVRSSAAAQTGRHFSTSTEEKKKINKNRGPN